MPSSKSSIDNRDVYYRLGKSSGYRARSAYKLIHLDEEFGLFEGVQTAVDLCAAPGSWSQVLTQRIKGDEGGDDSIKIVALDLQPMAPLPHVELLQADITQPSTVPRVLKALGGRKANLVVCDGAPDVTGVHDLDAYLHSQLILAALTLSLVLLADKGSLVFKIFLSPLDPKAAMLQSQLSAFFTNHPSGTGSAAFSEIPDEGSAEDSRRSEYPQHGVFVRKPRSSRPGSGEAFIICRGFDGSSVPWSHSTNEELLRLGNGHDGTLTLESMEKILPTDREWMNRWHAIKSYVSSGDLNSFPEAQHDIEQVLPEPHSASVPLGRNRSREPIRIVTDESRNSSSSTISPIGYGLDVPWDRRPTPLPSPNPAYDVQSQDQHATVSRSASTSSKNNLFFASSPEDPLPKPPKPLSFPFPRGGTQSPESNTTSPEENRERTSSLPQRTRALAKGLGHKKTISSDLTRPVTVLPTRSFSQPHADSPSSNTTHETLSTLPTHPNLAVTSQAAPQSHHNAPPRREVKETRDVGPPPKQGQVLVDGNKNWVLREPLGEGAFSCVWSTQVSDSSPTTSPLDLPSSTIFAVKLTSRSACSEDARTRVAFFREVSVLRHISHPNIVTFESSFSTETHHCLVLERLSGGELYDALTDERRWTQMTQATLDDPAGEGFTRRVFGELLKGVGWLHEVGVVHRDIKLENVLFTVNPFSFVKDDGSIPLEKLPSPLVKLTDFGLSRFIDLDNPLLETRCGSESFAAPEIIMGRSYDGRQTDCWALGVLLYALIAGQLPFDIDEAFGPGDRRKKMLRIAKADYSWPSQPSPSGNPIGSSGVRQLVGHLLVRDPQKRTTAKGVWNIPWMTGPGAVTSPSESNSIINGTDIDRSSQRVGQRRVLDGYLLDEEPSADGRAEMTR